jgi:hypothetical protein
LVSARLAYDDGKETQMAPRPPGSRARTRAIGTTRLWIRNNVLGLVAIFIALNGTAIAAQVGSDDGGIKGAKAAKKKKAKAVPGPAGPQGPQGPAGPSGSADSGPQILAKLAPVDGTGSGLDADLLDGLSSGAFLASGATAGGALGGAYPAPNLDVSGGPCANGQALVNVSNQAVLTCAPGVFSQAVSSNIAAGPALQAVTSGSQNAAFGFNALASTTNGSGNSALGSNALELNTGDANSAVGQFALNAASGFGNSGIGSQALQLNTGNENSAVGGRALLNNSGGNANTAVGHGALENSTGSTNTALGHNAGASLTSGTNNIDIRNVGVGSESNTTRIGSTQTRAFIAGIRGVTTAGAAIPVLIDANGQLGTTSSSRRFKTEIEPLGRLADPLMDLKPVSFHYKEGPAELHYGLIAEQVENAMPTLVAYGRDGLPETVQYQELPALLLAKVQDQERENESLRSQNRRQQVQIDWLMRQARGG